MTRHELTIRYAATRQRPTAAWLIPGEDAESWLSELIGWDVDLCAMTLRLVPRSRRDATVCGVLVTLSDGCTPNVSARCQEYGRIAQRCFLPVEAKWEPAVVESEVASLLEDRTSDLLFHPAAGLIIFREEQKMSGADLLCGPRAVPGQWDRACPGEAVVTRLALVEPEMQSSLEELLREGGDDIGSEDLASAQWARGAKSVAGRDVDSGGKEERGLLARLAQAAQWAMQTLRGVVRAVPSAEEQLDALLRMLERDPDEGLRYAVPLAESDHRPDTSDTGGELTRHVVDFSMNFGSAEGPRSSWLVSSSQYESLRRRYRELANRELQLRRYRRAAHIYANLLGDWSSAAAILASGKHWREAALIYRDRLNLPSEAAACLEKAGMYSEAVGLYAQLKQFEPIGDLYAKIGQHEDATSAYRQAVALHLEVRNFLAAARLLESQLQAPREALLILADGWPASDQAEQCLRETIRILETLKAHDETAALLRRLMTDEPRAPDVAEKAVSVLVRVAHDYSDKAIQHQAADQVRSLAGELLAGSRATNAPQLLRAIAELVPEDRLLQRDCQRYTRLTCSARRARADLRPALRLYPNWIFDLPANTTWRAAASDEQAWYFAGYHRQRLIVIRVPSLTITAAKERLQWSVDTITEDEEDEARERHCEDFEQLQWPVPSGLHGQPILLCPDPRRQAGLLLHAVGGPPLATTQKFRETDRIAGGQLIGPHRGFTCDTVSVARSLDGITWLANVADNTLSQAAYAPDEQRLGTCELPYFLAGQVPAGPIPVLAGLTHVILGFGNALCCLKRGFGMEMIRLPSPVRALYAPPDEYPQYSVVTCDNHLAVLWHTTTDNHLELFQDNALDAVCGFTRQGELFVAQTGRFEIYQLVNNHLQLRGSGTMPSRSPIAVLTTTRSDQIMVVSESGQVMRAAFA
jgi:tetratricopeptide (TPR) repeat protein